MDGCRDRPADSQEIKLVSICDGLCHRFPEEAEGQKKVRQGMSFPLRDSVKFPLYASQNTAHLEILLSLCEPQFPPVPVGVATPDWSGGEKPRV